MKFGKSTFPILLVLAFFAFIHVYQSPELKPKEPPHALIQPAGHDGDAFDFTASPMISGEIMVVERPITGAVILQTDGRIQTGAKRLVDANANAPPMG